ncbi:ATPase [Bacillus sp. HMSC76G11]|nr:ATPase [Bacillus sp. HMSC76G11]
MRFHLLPFLIPREGKVYELRTTMDAKILYFKDETAWTTMLSFLTRPWYRRWVKQEWISWEIAATKDEIRYFVWVPDEHIGRAFKAKFYAEHSDVEIVDADYSVDFSRPHAGTKLFTESHWTIPIKTYHNEVVDTQAELVEFLDDLEDGQEIHMQFLVQPAYRTEKSFRGIVRQFHKQGEYDETLEKDNELYLSAIEGKSTRVLSRIGVKVVAFGRDKRDSRELIKSAKGSIGTFSSGRLNQLKGREWWWFRTIRPLFRWEYNHRIYPMETMKKRVILGTEEMAAMMRLPSARVHSTKLNRLKMRSTPLPKELKNVEFDPSLSVTLGEHRYHGKQSDVMFDLATLRYHAAFIGMSGMGKSTAMYNLVEDLINLDGAGTTIGGTIIDPHGDLCQDIAARIPPDKQHLVRYIKFSEGEIPFNVYDVDFQATEDKIAQTVADVLKRTWKDFWGPNIDDNFLNGGIVLQRLGEASLPNLQKLLSDPEYRENILERLNREDAIENDLYLYFANLQGLQDRELQAKTNSTLNKLRKITLSGVLGKMLRAKTNGLRFRESMDQGMINLLDLSELTSDEKKLIGSMCLTYAELAGKSRADTPVSERHKLPYHFVMVDEAPTLMEHSIDAIESFASELRKYKTSIILGMQGIKDQLPREVASAIFRNFGTFVSFRLGEPDDAQYVNRSMSSEVLQETDYLQIEPYSAYMRMQVGNERTRPFLIRLKAPGRALYADSIPELKKRTINEAMEIEKKAALASVLKEQHKEDTDKAIYESYLDEEDMQDTDYPDYLTNEVAAAIEIKKDTDSKAVEKNPLLHLSKDYEVPHAGAQVLQPEEDKVNPDSEHLDSDRSSSEKKDSQKEKKTNETKKVISNDDLWV